LCHSLSHFANFRNGIRNPKAVGGGEGEGGDEERRKRRRRRRRREIQWTTTSGL
jgi:hypothetical protein